MAVRALPLAQSLVRRGHTVAMFLPPWSYPQDAGKTWDAGGVTISNVRVSTRARIPLDLLAQTRAFSPDAVHIFKPKAYAGMVQWMIWQLRALGFERVRLVLDEDDWEGAGGWNDREAYSPLQKRFFAWQEGWGLTHADRVTVASRALESIVWSLGVARDKVLYLPNGINALPTDARSRAQVRAELGLGDAPTLLLYTRFFEFELARLGRILAQVFAVAPSAKLLVVGKGMYGEDAQLAEMAKAAGWYPNLVSVGWAEPEQLGGLFRAADVALYPFDDTLINRTKAAVKLMDLLAAGVPVVAEAVGQIREYIKDGTSGVLVAPGDADGFARAVIDLLKDAERRERLGACAAASVRRAFDWDVLAAQVERTYQREAGGSSRTGVRKGDS